MADVWVGSDYGDSCSGDFVASSSDLAVVVSAYCVVEECTNCVILCALQVRHRTVVLGCQQLLTDQSS